MIIKSEVKETSLSEGDFIRGQLDQSESAAQKYATLVIGKYALLPLLKYELITCLFGWVPGALGLALRKTFYPWLFTNIGRGVVFGKNVTIRNAARMQIGDRVMIDDDAFIDARGAAPGAFVLEDDVLVGRGAVLQSKSGDFHVGARANIGSHCSIIAQGGIDIANDVFIGGDSKISGGLFRLNDQHAEQVFDRYSKGPVNIMERSVLGMGCIVIDNVTIGSRTLIGSGVTISSDIPDDSIVGSRPPLVMKKPDPNTAQAAQKG